MNAKHDDDKLLSLADKIAEGTTLDREAEQQGATDHADEDVLEALLDIAVIEAAHRSAERAFDRMPSGARDAPRQWCHLTILEKIGEGAFGAVYRAHDSKLQIDVALKLSACDASQTASAFAVLDEARLLAKVRHPNVVRVYGADHKQGRVGLWMDLVQGRTLEELTKTQGFGASEAINIGIDLCRALAAVHSVGVLHGDIKAHNVMRRDGGQFVLVDFGAGRPLAAQPNAGDDLVGTPVYLAPEVLNDQLRSTASDIYSLGVLLFHLVTNDYPVYAHDREAFVEAHRSGARKRLRDLRPDLPDGFIQVIERATSADPRARFASAGALEAALVQLINPPAPPPPSRGRRVWPTAMGAGAILAVAAILLLSPFRPTAVIAEPGPPTSRLPQGDIYLPADSYDIDAAFYRQTATGRERLAGDSRLRVNDEIHLSIETSAATYLYVVNEDEKDRAFLLFPHADAKLTNPVAANQRVRLPSEHNWKVDSIGGKEHFIVLASNQPLTSFEDAFKRLPSPRSTEGSHSDRLPPEALQGLRSVGGLAPVARPNKTISNFHGVFTTPLVGRETARGFWARQLTLENSGR
jgi:serine/threonine protein kinase